MADIVRETRTIERDRGDIVEDNTAPAKSTVAARIISLITGIILTLLAMRFIFSLLGANKDSAIGNFVYSVTEPLVAPFFSLFNYSTEFGISTFEFQTLVAIVFYAFLGYLLTQLFTVGRSDHQAIRR